MSRWNRRRVAAATLAATLGVPGPQPGAKSSRGELAWGPVGAAAAPPQQGMLDERRGYAAYVPAAVKEGQFAQYTCEFDAAWAVLKTFGVDVSLDEQVAAIGLDPRIEPYYEATTYGFVVYGGDITETFSGDYTQNFLARTTGQAMQKIFANYAVDVETVNDRAGIAAALDRGALVWMKATVDFLPWEPVTWVTPEGRELPGVLGNDHAVVVMGYNSDVAVIRDILGPTSSNWNRPFEYEVPWETLLAVWEAQGFDGLAVTPQGS
jgi:hypothetical protein